MCDIHNKLFLCTRGIFIALNVFYLQQDGQAACKRLGHLQSWMQCHRQCPRHCWCRSPLCPPNEKLDPLLALLLHEYSWQREHLYISEKQYLWLLDILKQYTVRIYTITLAHDSSVITTTAAWCWITRTVIQGGFRPSALHSSDGRCQFRGAKETTTNSSGTCARKVECQQIVLSW